MDRPRFAGIGFAIIWLAIFVVFTYGSEYASGFAVYALLAAYIGLKRSYLVRSYDSASVACALTFGAALYFGPIGGAIVGVMAALLLRADSEIALPSESRLSRAIAGSAAGLVAGYSYVWISTLANLDLLFHAGAMAASAVAFVVITAAVAFTANRNCFFDSASKRMRAGISLSMELALGMTLAAAVRLLSTIFDSQAILLVMPVVYMARQLLDELLPKESGKNLADVYLSAMQALVGAIDARDRYTRMHTSNVTTLALSLGRRMQLSDEEMEGLRVASLFHDVGKLWIPEHILLRPGKLDQDQLAKVQSHPALGQRMLDAVNFPWSVGEIVRSHHERWDGTGYPDHRKGDEIPLAARILCLADVFDAMTSKRLYRPSNTIQDTLKYIRQSSGTHFDPSAVQVLDRLIADGDMPDVYQAMMTDTASVAVQPSEAEEKSKQADEVTGMSSEFVAVFEIAQTAGTSLDLEEMLRLLTAKIRSMVPCGTCAIFLRNEENGRLEAKAALGDNARHYQGAYAQIGRGQTGMVAQTGRGIIANYNSGDVILSGVHDPMQSRDWLNPRSVMIVPIVAEDEVIGTVNLYQGSGRPFSEEDLLLATAVAPQVGKAIQNALLFKKTSETAITDVMTGLHNARHLFSCLDEELTNSKRDKKPVSVLCMDIDNFKLVNDLLGHQQGDEVLRDVAQLCCSQVRESDVVCRYGGDEFVVILPGLGKMEALMTKRRLEVLVDNQKPYGSSPNQVRIGLSIGVATFPEDGGDSQELISCADASMYSTKRRRKGESARAA